MQHRTRKRSMSRRVAFLTLLALSVATPAFAAVIIQNFMKVEFIAEAACFEKVGGQDAIDFSDDTKSPYAAVDTASTINVNGVDLLQESVTVKAMAGDRTIYSDVVRYRNTCDYALDVTLTVEADPNGGTATNWTPGNMTVSMYISDPLATGAAAPAPWGVGVPLGVGGWSTTPIVITSAGAAPPASTTPVRLSPGEELAGGFQIDVKNGYATTVDTPAPTITYTAAATAVANP